ncbi:hypothetical protein [Liquorilactobacillus capillatus]|uniref:Uncharacterized protein n=1 Tax=Liquorilactobacillus capillatus DSM 19910 TaxID=1423731 RepID=A0A0R1M6Y8_9LACO|nr:hypothetical protein [Liquorilactobacillus capillatus]KRL00821.1 hypothetical protein FC81_GL001654 [Liquorilactobacillus capillatus DSM 19910]
MNKDLRVILALAIISLVILRGYLFNASPIDAYLDYGTVFLALIVMPRPKFALWPRKTED